MTLVEMKKIIEKTHGNMLTKNYSPQTATSPPLIAAQPLPGVLLYQHLF